MKKLKLIASAIALSAILTSCSVTYPVSVSAASMGTKVGTSKTTVLFRGLQFNRSFGIAEAAKNGKITGPIGIVDMKVTNYILFTKKEIIVYGN